MVCLAALVLDPTAPPRTYTGVLLGGPLVVLDSSLLPGSGTLTCRLQVGVADHTGTGPWVAGHGNGVVTAGPAGIALVDDPLRDVYLCGEFTDDSDGTTYYWDESDDPRTANRWSTDPTVQCLRLAAITQDLGPVRDVVCGVVPSCPLPPAGDPVAFLGVSITGTLSL